MRRRFLSLLAAPLLACAQDRTHVVAEGDTLTALAATYGVNGSAILEANGLRSAVLVPGRRLVIPGDAPEPTVARAEPVPVARPAEPVVDEPRAVDEPGPAESIPQAERDPAPVRPEAGGSEFSALIAQPAGAGVRYNGRWTPPGESEAWVMDCSNTARWLHRAARGVQLPRTASAQYEWLRARGRLWRSRPDADRLRQRLQPGDLLFWENTYRPVRRPPITHVMVYLGTDARGRMMMAGSQNARGVDTYEFRPAQRMGGYRFFFFFRRDGRFVAFGRP